MSENLMPDHKVTHLIAKRILRGLDERELLELESWLQQDERNRLLYERIANKDRLRENMECRAGVDVKKARNSYWRLMENRRERKRFGMYRYAVAACLLLLLSVGIILLYKFRYEKDALELTENIVPGTYKAVLILDDGRRVELGKGVRDKKVFEQGGAEDSIRYGAFGLPAREDRRE